MAATEMSSAGRPNGTASTPSLPASEPAQGEDWTQLVGALQTATSQHHALQRSHSFQLVGLQSQVHELQQNRAQDLQARDALRDETASLQSSIVYLKSRIASLAVDMACLESRLDQSRPGTAQPARPQMQQQGGTADQQPARPRVQQQNDTAQQQPARPQVQQQNDTAQQQPARPQVQQQQSAPVQPQRQRARSFIPPGSLIGRLSAAGDSVDALADKLLREQKQESLLVLGHATSQRILFCSPCHQ